MIATNFDFITQQYTKSNLRIAIIQSNLSISQSEETILNIMQEYDLEDDQIFVEIGVNLEDAYITIEELICDGYTTFFVDDLDLKDCVIQFATEYPSVDFWINQGGDLYTMGLDNLHSYVFNESQVWYMIGLIAGITMNDMINMGIINDDEAIIGFIREEDNAYNTSAYTAMYLGAKSICTSVQMKVKNSQEENVLMVSKSLIANGCVFIAQYEPSISIDEICEENDIYYVSSTNENIDNLEFNVITNIDISSACYSKIIDTLITGEELATDLIVSYESGYNVSIELNKVVFSTENIYDDVIKKMEEAIKEFELETLYVFQTDLWTVNGEKVYTTASDDLEEIYFGNEYISLGRFMEYEISSIRQFYFKIDGIEELI